jgi:hypothetical protein
VYDHLACAGRLKRLPQYRDVHGIAEGAIDGYMKLSRIPPSSVEKGVRYFQVAILGHLIRVFMELPKQH